MSSVMKMTENVPRPAAKRLYNNIPKGQRKGFVSVRRIERDESAHCMPFPELHMVMAAVNCDFGRGGQL